MCNLLQDNDCCVRSKVSSSGLWVAGVAEWLRAVALVVPRGCALGVLVFALVCVLPGGGDRFAGCLTKQALGCKNCNCGARPPAGPRREPKRRKAALSLRMGWHAPIDGARLRCPGVGVGRAAGRAGMGTHLR